MFHVIDAHVDDPVLSGPGLPSFASKTTNAKVSTPTLVARTVLIIFLFPTVV